MNNLKLIGLIASLPLYFGKRILRRVRELKYQETKSS
jgi:hypothetical protein